MPTMYRRDASKAGPMLLHTIPERVTLHRGGYIPHGCDQQGRLETGDYIRERQEQAADMARLCGADTSDAAEIGEGAGVLLWPLAIIAVVAVGSWLVAVFV